MTSGFHVRRRPAFQYLSPGLSLLRVALRNLSLNAICAFILGSMVYEVCVAESISVASRPKIDVKSLIEFTRITQPEDKAQLEDEISPDEKHFFIVTRRQDLAANKNTYKLTLYDMGSFAANAGGRPNIGRVLAETYSSSDYLFEHAFRSAKWVDRSTIAFLGEFEDRATQVYSVNIDSGRITQLTNHPTPVLAFSYEPKAKAIVYICREPVDISRWQHPSFVIGNSTLTQLLFPNDLRKQQLIYRYYRSFTDQPDAIKPLGEPFRMGRVPPLFSLSPDGRWVVTRSTPADLNETMRLAKTYEPLRTVLESYLASDEDPLSYFTEDYSSLLVRMKVFEVRTGREMPWYDVPDGSSMAGEWPFAHWMPDGRSVVIANTFLPITGVDEAEARRRTQVPALIEYWPEEGRFAKIDDMVGDTRAFEGLYAMANDGNAVYIKQNGAITVLRRKGTKWSRDDASRLHDDPTLRRKRVRVIQTSNEPPEVFYEAPGARPVRITDLNPQLRQLDIGNAETYEWTDKSGRQWHGGLLLPSDFRKDRRYPLVIQLGGFAEDDFYLDGPRHIASAMAGRAYLREGILVLAEPGSYLQTGDRRSEFFAHDEGLAAAIEDLAARGVVDPERVGVVGFSARGSIAQYLITFGHIKLRAATIADSATTSLFSAAAYFFGFYKPGMLTVERRLDAKPWGPDVDIWARRDPSLHTDCIEAAIRYEFYNLYPQPSWDSYALLKRQYKPAEAVMFPRGTHQLRRPQERYESLQGNVDWFRFWLKDEEDPDSAKLAQYRRWREMKEKAPPVNRHSGCLATN